MSDHPPTDQLSPLKELARRLKRRHCRFCYQDVKSWRKELREEAGLLAEDWQLLGEFAPYKGASNEIDYFFLARDLTWTAQELEPSEEITVHRMPLAQARERLLGQSLVEKNGCLVLPTPPPLTSRNLDLGERGEQELFLP